VRSAESGLRNAEGNSAAGCAPVSQSRQPEREWSSLVHGATSRDADAGRSNVFIISFHSVTRSSFALSNANMYTRVRVCTAVHIYAHSSAPTPVPRRAAGADCVQCRHGYAFCVEYRGHLRDVVALRVEPHVVGRVPDLFEDAPHVLPRPTAHILKDDDLRPNLMYSLRVLSHRSAELLCMWMHATPEPR
jgi:hypothetical protein